MAAFSVLILYLILFVSSNMCQMCKTPGEWCADTNQCCGGCCIGQTCIETFRDCTYVQHPCLEHYCPAGSVCRLFQPKCSGCDFQTECVFLNNQNDDLDFEIRNTNSMSHYTSSSNSLTPHAFIVFGPFLTYIYITYL